MDVKPGGRLYMGKYGTRFIVRVMIVDCYIRILKEGQKYQKRPQKVSQSRETPIKPRSLNMTEKKTKRPIILI